MHICEDGADYGGDPDDAENGNNHADDKAN